MSLFPKHLSQARARLVQAGSALVAAAMVAGCGAGYRPVVTPINPTGPASQPSSLVAVVSSPSATSPGIATIIDYAGDSILAQAPIGPGPSTFTVDETGSAGYTVNSDGTLTNFPVDRTQLQPKNITYTTLPSTSRPLSLFSPSAGLWVADLSGNQVDVLVGSPAVFKLSIPVVSTPVSVIGAGLGGQRYFVIEQASVSSGLECNLSPTTGLAGLVEGIEVTSYTVSSQITVGKCPVFAVQSPDGRRLFVLNRGDDTISVINSQNNTLDTCTPFLNQNGKTVTCHPSLPLSLTAVNTLNAANPGSGNPPNGTAGMGTTAGPIYAEFNSATNQLVVADYDGGTVSVIDVSLDEYGNDSPTFGTTFTIPVGKNPASVTALFDGSRAYTADQSDGTVSIVNLISHTLEKKLTVNGHPRTVVSTQNSLQGKVYASSPDSPYLTIVRTDQDIVDATVLVEGNIVDVRVSTQDAVRGNPNVVSRKPGYGQPCNLPPLPAGSAYPAGYMLADCQKMP